MAKNNKRGLPLKFTAKHLFPEEWPKVDKERQDVLWFFQNGSQRRTKHSKKDENMLSLKSLIGEAIDTAKKEVDAAAAATLAASEACPGEPEPIACVRLRTHYRLRLSKSVWGSSLPQTGIQSAQARRERWSETTGGAKVRAQRMLCVSRIAEPRGSTSPRAFRWTVKEHTRLALATIKESTARLRGDKILESKVISTERWYAT